jgi:hypothetical protein
MNFDDQIRPATAERRKLTATDFATAQRSPVRLWDGIIPRTD